MNAALLISAVSLLLSLVSILLVANILWAKNRQQLPLPRFTSRRKKSEPDADVTAGLQEWPEWTVEPGRLHVAEVDEALSSDPKFSVNVV